jgi:enoyl-CoA hydratase/carnithine racemase
MEADFYKFIKTEIKGHVLFITLARPAKRNAFTPTMLSEINHAINFAKNETSIWLVVLLAEGSVFCAGMDLNVFQNPDLDKKNEAIELIDKPLGDILAELNKPIICVVDGAVLAGGMLFVAESTFVMATENAKFQLPEVKRGLFPFQVMNSLSGTMPMQKILELCILGEEISAEKALELGIVTKIIQSSNLENELNILIDKILKNAPLAISKGIEMSKKISSIPESEKNTRLKLELEKLLNSADAQEGIFAFMEKREAVWRNE